MPRSITRPTFTIRPPVRAVSITLLCVGLGGCSPLESEYFWQREDDGAGFVLQYRLDLPRKEIRFVEIQLPTEPGAGAPKVKPVNNIDDCQFSDARNWNCEDRGYGDESIYMIKGDLHYNFFNEYRKYQLRNVLMARLEPCWRPAFAACGRAVRALFAGAQS
jgi:hypothetical protein